MIRSTVKRALVGQISLKGKPAIGFYSTVDISNLEFLFQKNWKLKIAGLYPELIHSRNRGQLLSALTGWPPSRFCSRVDEIKRLSNLEILAVYTILKSYGISYKDKDSFLKVLQASPIHLMTILQSYQEIGIINKEFRMLSDFTLVYERTLSALKAMHLISSENQVLENIFKLLCVESEEDFRSLENLKYLPLNELFYRLIYEYLQRKFPCDDVRENFEPSLSSPIVFSNVVEIIDILMKCYQFSPTEIYENLSWIFSLQPFNIVRIRREIFSESMLSVIHECPDIIRLSAADLLENIDILSLLKIPLNMIHRYSHLLNIPPNQLKLHVTNCLENPEFLPLIGDRDFKLLFDKSTIAKKRLAYLGQLKIAFPSISTIVAPYERFSMFLKADRKMSDVSILISFLSTALLCDPKHIKKQLRRNNIKVGYDLFQVSLNVKQLQAKGYSSTQVANAIMLLMYQWKTIEAAINNVTNQPTYKTLEEWEGHNNFLQLVLYCLEKQMQ